MCVIVFKPRGEEIADADIEAMFRQNPHGAGFAWFDERGIMVRKGFMTVEALKAALPAIKPYNATVHFRLATHGQKNAEQTHPFVVSPFINESKALDIEGPYDSVVFHNGIMSQFGGKDFSDTLEFVTQVLAHVPTTETRCRLLESMPGKFALLEGEKTWLTDGFIKHGNLSVSNLTWNNAPIVIGGRGNYRHYGAGFNSAWEYGSDGDDYVPAATIGGKRLDEAEPAASYGPESYKRFHAPSKTWETNKARKARERRERREKEAERAKTLTRIADTIAAEHGIPVEGTDLLEGLNAPVPDDDDRGGYLTSETAEIQRTIREALRRGSLDGPCEHVFDEYGECLYCLEAQFPSRHS